MSKIHFLRDAKSSKFLRRASWLFGLSAMVVIVFCLVTNIVPTSGQAQDLNQQFANDGDDDDCSSRSPSIRLPTTKL
jgi:uncharacterized membrane protein